MSGNLERALAILELLAKNGGRLPLHAIADTLNVPRSATHRLLSMLMQQGYVRQDQDHGEYQLALKLVSLGLIYLSTSGIIDVAQPVLDRLAGISGEMVRLSVVQDNSLTFVGKAQGARSGLRYDPDMGKEAPLFCTASGQAWLLHLTDEQALEIVSRQGFGKPGDRGPNAPATIPQFLKELQAARKRGYSMTIETYEAGMTAMAAAIRHPVSNAVIGTVSIAGPHTRFTEARMKALAPALMEAATELSAAALGSPSFSNVSFQPVASAPPAGRKKRSVKAA